MTAIAQSATRMAADKADWTLGATLRDAAAARPQHDAIRTMDGFTLTYREVLDHAEQRAAGLVDLGVRPGDRVVLMMDNSVEMLITWFAVNLSGAVEVPSNTANRGRSLEHVINNSGASVAIIDSAYVEVFAKLVGDVPMLTTVLVNASQDDVRSTDLPWKQHDLAQVKGDPGDLASVEITYRDPAAIIFTSGTSGPAKGVMMPHGHMYTFAGHVADQLELSSDDVYYVCLPLFHANAQFMQVYASVIAQATIVLADAFSATKWIEDVNACGATVSSLLGVMAQYIYNQPPSAVDADHRVRRMITIPLPAAIAEDFQRRFDVDCLEAYGMTEVCLPITRRLGDTLRPGSCGKPLEEWFEVAIVDPDTDEILGDDEVGEIVVRPRSPFTTFSEYHDMPERTVEAWRNLWFHTGDAGRRDSDGYYYFVDRLKDRIRRKGENVTAYDIEIALTELEDVLDVAVIAKPAAEGEDEIKAFIVLAEGAAVEPLALLRHCAERLPYFAVPRYLEFIADLPKTPSGKILKRELRAMGATPVEWDREEAGYTVRRGDAGVVSKQG